MCVHTRRQQVAWHVAIDGNANRTLKYHITDGTSLALTGANVRGRAMEVVSFGPTTGAPPDPHGDVAAASIGLTQSHFSRENCGQSIGLAVWKCIISQIADYMGPSHGRAILTDSTRGPVTPQFLQCPGWSPILKGDESNLKSITPRQPSQGGPRVADSAPRVGECHVSGRVEVSPILGQSLKIVALTWNRRKQTLVDCQPIRTRYLGHVTGDQLIGRFLQDISVCMAAYFTCGVA
eukprot:sb/3469222/